MSEKDYTKVEAWQCDVCNSLYDHPSLADRCAVKCRWYEIVSEIAGEKSTHKKLELADRVDEIKDELQRLKEND